MSQANRRQAREQAFALLFELSFHPDSTLQDMRTIYDDEQEPPALDEFALALVQCVEENMQALDEEIAGRLRGWKLNRISRATHAILRLAVCEMHHFDDIPVGATINEAVELAKLYAEDEAPKFINGLLGAIARQEPGSEP